MACTGIEFCKLAIGETKGRAPWLTTELEPRLPDFDEDVRIHVNGCPNSCARFQVADIGLMSALRTRPDGYEVRRVPRAPRWHDGRRRRVRAEGAGVKIYAEDAADYLELLLRRYRQQRADGDTFTSFVNALDADALGRFAEPPPSHGELR